jgi:hypothetical protein
MTKRPRTSTRFVDMKEAGITREQLIEWFGNDALAYRSVHNAYKVGSTYFVLPLFSLSDDE